MSATAWISSRAARASRRVGDKLEIGSRHGNRTRLHPHLARSRCRCQSRYRYGRRQPYRKAGRRYRARRRRRRGDPGQYRRRQRQRGDLRRCRCDRSRTRLRLCGTGNDTVVVDPSAGAVKLSSKARPATMCSIPAPATTRLTAVTTTTRPITVLATAATWSMAARNSAAAAICSTSPARPARRVPYPDPVRIRSPHRQHLCRLVGNSSCPLAATS